MKATSRHSWDSDLQGVYDAYASFSKLADLYLATCDDEIAAFVARFGRKVVMTQSDYQFASDRSSDSLEILEKGDSKSFDSVFMLQSDVSLIGGETITTALKPLKDDVPINIVNLINKIPCAEDLNESSYIKVAFSNNFSAQYFSRLPIPFIANMFSLTYYNQFCVIPFLRDYLKEYLLPPPTLVEEQEPIDVLVKLEHGDHVKFVPTEILTLADDCSNDPELVETFLTADTHLSAQ